MAHLCCQVLHRPHRLTFIWSQEASSFEPYHLTGPQYQEFWEQVRQVNARLEEALAGRIPLTALARAGCQLRRALFPADAPHAVQSHQIQHWLQELQAQQRVDSLAMLSDDPGTIPWNLVFDGDPDQAGKDLDQSAFWGWRYNLTVGRRVGSLWPIRWLVEPHVLLVVDPQLVEKAADLVAFANAKGLPLVQGRDSLQDHLEDDDPDFVYLFCRSSGASLHLGDVALPVADFHQLLMADRQESADPVLCASLCPEGEADGQTGRYLAQLFPALIAGDRPLPAERANELGLKILERVLCGGEPIGKELQHLRSQTLPEGLLFHCYCPPQLRITWTAEAAEQEESDEVLHPLPAAPYRPLAPYDSEQRALFVGREGDVNRCAALLDQAQTRLLLLHGASGVGKTSLLHAGLVPYLEDDCHGYWALRDRTPEDQPQAEKEYPVLAIRASGDLAGQLAEALCAFCSQPYRYTTPIGQTVVVDLPHLLHDYVYHSGRLQTAVQAVPEESVADTVQPGPLSPTSPTEPAPETDPRSVWEELEKNPDFLGQLLIGLTLRLPFELLVLIEQGEELFTQGATSPSQGRRQRALAMLAAAAGLAGQFKLVMSLRTDFYGRLLTELSATGSNQLPAIKNFLLEDLSKEAMVEAILLPTANEEIPFSAQVPFQKYCFQFEEDLPATIVEEALAVSGDEGLPPLPLIQATCAGLAGMLQERTDRVIRAADLKNLGGVAKSLDNLVAGRLRSLPLSGSARAALQRLMQNLYTRQPGGSLSRRLVPVRQLAEEWTNRTSFEEAVQAADDLAGLLEIQRLLVGGKGGNYLALRHDVLAQADLRWHEDRQRKRALSTGRVDLLWIMLPLLVLVVALTFFFTRKTMVDKGEDAISQDKVAELEKKVQKIMAEQEEAVQLPLYAGLMARAEKAWLSGNLLEMRQLLLSHQKRAHEVDGRGFEWYYLWRLANRQRATLVGHRGPVGALAASADGTLLATAGSEGTIWLWNAGNGQERARLRSHQGAVHALAFAPDGKTLASAGEDKTVLLWDLNLGKEPAVLDKPARKLNGHQGPVRALAFAPRQPVLVSAGEDQAVIFWDAAQGKEQKKLSEHKAAVHALAFAPDGATLASAAADGTVVLWDAAAMSKRQTWQASKGAVHTVAFAAEGKLLAAGGGERRLDHEVGVIRFWDVAAAKETSQVLNHASKVFTLAFAADGKTLASGGTDNCLRLWNLASGAERTSFKGHLGWLKALAFVGDKTLASGSFDGTVKLWDLNRPPDLLAAHKGGASALAFFANDSLLATGGYDGNVKLWDPTTGQLRNTLTGLKGAVLSVALTGKGKDWKLAAASLPDQGPGEIKIWDLKIDKEQLHSKELPSLPGHTEGVWAVAFNPDGSRLASASKDKTVILWDWAAGKIVQKMTHPAAVHCLAFSNTGTRLATGSSDHMVRFWDPSTGKEIMPPLLAHSAPVTSVGFAENDGWLVTTSFDQTLKAWLLRKGTPVLNDNLRGHAGPVLTSLVTARGDLYASGGADHVIRLWDWRRGKIRFALTGHTGPIRALAASSDRLTLASASLDGTVRLWRAAAPINVDLPDRKKDQDHDNGN